MHRPYSLSSARVLAAGRSEDKSFRTAGQRAKSDPPLQKLPDPWLPRVVLWIERRFR